MNFKNGLNYFWNAVLGGTTVVEGDFGSVGTAIDWDLIDNTASALSFDTAGKAGVLEIVTTTDEEGIKTSGRFQANSYSAVGMGGAPTKGTVLTVGFNNSTMPAGTTAARGFFFGGNVTELAGATITDICAAYFNTFTITDGGGVETVGDVATVIIYGAPTAGSTPTNGPYALYVKSGTTRFGGSVQLDSSVTMGDAVVQFWDIAPASDHTWSGDTETGTAGENIALGDLVYLKADGKYYIADADASTTMPAVLIATAAITAAASGTFLKKGVFRDDSWDWTIGGALYVSTSGTGSTLTQTAPSGDLDVVQIVGYALTADVIVFDPSPITAEIGLDVSETSASTSIAITMAELSAQEKVFHGNNASDQTYTLAVPVAADIGKKFCIMKTGTGAGKAILQAGAGVTLISAAAQSAAAGTAYLAASAYGSMTWMVTSATTVQLLAADGTITFT